MCLPAPADIPHGADVPVEMAAARLAQGWCDALFGCDCGDLAPFPDRDTCIAELRQRFTNDIDGAQGRGLTYDGTCVETIADFPSYAGCKANDQIRDPENLEACNRMACAYFTGPKALGEACVPVTIGIEECAAGLRCDGTLQTCVVSDCTPFLERGGPGEVCNSPRGNTRYCVEGYACDQDRSNCCVPPFALGEHCGSTYQCEEGSVCEAPAPMDFMNAVCIEPKGEGEPCFSQVCAEGLTCLVESGATEGACGARRAEGEPCVQASDCATQHCLELACAPTPGLGEPCSGTCTEGLACSYHLQPPTCVTPGAADGPCLPGDPPSCDAGLACNGRYLCQAPIAAGEPCTRQDACADGNLCHPVSNTCAAPVPAICGLR
jgi:hypothetical protein